MAYSPTARSSRVSLLELTRESAFLSWIKCLGPQPVMDSPVCSPDQKPCAFVVFHEEGDIRLVQYAAESSRFSLGLPSKKNTKGTERPEVCVLR